MTKKIPTSSPVLDKLFTKDTLSVHIIQGKPIVRKEGKPGERKLKKTDKSWDKKEIESFIQALEKEISTNDHAFKEIQRKYSFVRQIGEYRIVLVSPPVAPVREITIVRPLVHLSLDEYKLDETVVERLKKPGHGILIAGAPGEGKTTFAQALLGSLTDQDLIIKTIEAPRDVQLDGSVTQYGLAHTTHNEIRDILLLTRPDITLFDEVRNTEDFHLYKDLRLAGIGLVGVMHATTAIDALQRSIGVISLGMIAQVLDTLIFIKGGVIQEILTLKQVVKTPIGMNSEDLARPVLVISSLLSNQDVYELYTYSDNVVVMPLTGKQHEQQPPIYKFAEHTLQRQIRSSLGIPVTIKVTGPSAITLYVASGETGRVIGRQGARIDALQKELGVGISVKTFDELRAQETTDKKTIQHNVELLKKGRKEIAELHLPKSYSSKHLILKIQGRDYPMTVDERGIIVLRKKRLVQAVIEGEYDLTET